MEQKKISEESLGGEVFKIGLGTEVRRISLNGSNGYEQLRKSIEDVFDELPERWVLQYVDDEGDLISVSTEKEFQEALKILRKMKVPSLKFGIAAKVQAPSTQAEPSQTQTQSTPSKPAPVEFISSLLKGIDISLENPNKEQNLPHSPLRKEIPKDVVDEDRRKTKEFHAASCDSCKSKIPGDKIRFKCNECEDFDLCETCRWTPHDESHSFIEIQDPKLVVHRASCDYCSLKIVGDRYKCSQCPDYDLCSTCYKSKDIIHKDHTFNKVERTPNLPKEITLNLPPQAMPFVSQLLNIFGDPTNKSGLFSSLFAPPPVNNNNTTTTTTTTSSPAPTPSLSSIKTEEPVKMEEDLHVKYQSQIVQLKEMGFLSEQENLEALIKSEGNTEKAIQILLG